MTRRCTRSSCKHDVNLSVPITNDTATKSRSKKSKIVDSDEDEYEGFSEPKSPVKNRMKIYEAVTPPKQKKKDITPDCKTTVTECYTPSTLLNKLSLTSPVRTKPSNRKSLFTTKQHDEIKSKNIVENGLCNLEVHCKQDTTKLNCYRQAHKALHSSLPTNLPGREKELNELRSFIMHNIVNCSSGSLYVSGPPGTGKTAALSIILQDKEVEANVKHVYVNCTAIKSPTAIYSRIIKELFIKVNGKTGKDYLNAIENYLKKSKKMILMVLDEIDQLENKNQSILYTIFEWPSKTNVKLLLIGVANALDLTDRTLPRLQAKCELKPKLMHFAPYTKSQIMEIFTSRLKDAGALDVFSPMALQMLAGKVAAVSGDIRRALDIGRRVVELIDKNKDTEAFKSVENLANCIVDQDSTNTKKVDLKEVLNVLKNVYGTTQNLTEDSEDAFPLQQKIIICSFLLMLKKAKNKDITIGKLHDVYKKVCSKRNILAVDQSEFVGLCNLIETRGIIHIIGKKEPRLNKVHLEWDEGEVAATLKDKQLMSMILQDDSCLGNF